MRRILNTPVCSFLVIASLLTSLAPAAAQRSTEETYESPTYGYTLTYDSEEWEVTEDTTDESVSVDILQLNNGVSFVLILGDPNYADLEECIEAEIDFLLNQENASDQEPLDDPDAEGEDDDRTWTTYTFSFENEDGSETDVTRYIECRDIGDGVTLIIYQDVASRRYQREVEAREDLLAGLEIPESGGRTQSAGDEETYESPTNGYTVTYDPETWEVSDDPDEDDEYDIITFDNGTSSVSFTGDRDYGGEDNVPCVEAYAFLLEVTSNVEDIEPLDDRDASGEEDDRAWGTYAYVDTSGRDDTDTIVYIECRSLADVSLVIQHTAPAEDYEDEVEAREDLVDGFDAGDAALGSNQGGNGGSTDAGAYESPHYGYTLTYDPDTWEVTEEDADPDDAYDYVVLENGTSTVRVYGNADYTTRQIDDCLEDTISVLETADGVEDVEPLDDRDAEGEDDDRAWATVSYSYTNENGDQFEWVRYLECRALGDGVTLIVNHDAPPADYEDEVEAREDLLAGLDLSDLENDSAEGD